MLRYLHRQTSTCWPNSGQVYVTDQNGISGATTQMPLPPEVPSNEYQGQIAVFAGYFNQS